MNNTDWRFYFFKCDSQNYLFDSFTHKIYSITENLFLLLKYKNYTEIKNHYNKFFKKVIKSKEHKFINKKTKECYVTINFSNKCNLNCAYCYRQRNKEDTLTTQDLQDIMKYVRKKYDPKASAYIFSLCYTSESSLDLEKLRHFDYLVGLYEGYLFTKNQLTFKTANKIYLTFPEDIRNKYSEITNENYIDIFNKILISDKLWDFFDYSTNKDVKESLAKTTKLSYSRKIKINRLILNKVFEVYGIDKPIKYIAQSFMTNGTNITDEYIEFIKSILLDQIYVSIDGTEQIHNKNRIYPTGEGSFYDTYSGIKKLQKAGIKVIASVVITPAFPELDIITSYLISIGIKEISFNLVRGKSPTTQFSENDIDKLLSSISRLLTKFFSEIEKGNISEELLALKNTMIFTPLKNLYIGTKTISRCTWGNELVIDSKGEIYHCNSTIGYRKDCLGSFTKNKSRHKLLTLPNIQIDKRCKNCFAKYLCGGTCYAEKIFENNQNENIECYFKKQLIILNFNLYAKLQKNHLLKKFMEIII